MRIDISLMVINNEVMKEVKANKKSLGEEIKKVLINYVYTQFILMIMVSLAVWGILALLHIKYALILAILTGVLSAVPNIGMIIATVVIVLITIFDKAVFLPNSPAYVEGIVVLIILVSLNKLVDLLLAPLLLGKTNKINPLLLIVVVFLGTVLLGIPGAILATPLILVVNTIWKYYGKK